MALSELPRVPGKWGWEAGVSADMKKQGQAGENHKQEAYEEKNQQGRSPPSRSMRGALSTRTRPRSYSSGSKPSRLYTQPRWGPGQPCLRGALTTISWLEKGASVSAGSSRWRGVTNRTGKGAW